MQDSRDLKETRDLLRGYTGHETVYLTSRGNQAIRLALGFAKVRTNRAIVPDQGSWLTHREYPRKLGMDATVLATDNGVIDTARLARAMAPGYSCLIYQNPAGYFASQPSREIYETAQDKCLVIADVTGCIGDSALCNGRHADILVASFGKGKVASAGFGGFVSFRSDPGTLQGFCEPEFTSAQAQVLRNAVARAPKRLAKLYALSEKVKNALREYDICHRDKKGINVVVRTHSEGEMEQIVRYCTKNKYEYTICPRYIRILKSAVSIEIKRCAA